MTTLFYGHFLTYNEAIDVAVAGVLVKIAEPAGLAACIAAIRDLYHAIRDLYHTIRDLHHISTHNVPCVYWLVSSIIPVQAAVFFCALLNASPSASASLPLLFM